MDILIRPTAENAKALLDALQDSGFGTAALTDAESLLAHEITIFKDKVRIDVQTRTPGIDFDEAYERRSVLSLAGNPVSVVSLDDLIASRRASGRQRYLEDALVLEEIRRRS
jgi:hypothetical protein